MSGDTTRVPKNQEKSLRSKGQRLWEKVRCFCENSEPGKWKFCLPSSHRETEDCSAYTTHNMHKIGNLVLYKEHAVDLLAQIKAVSYTHLTLPTILRV